MMMNDNNASEILSELQKAVGQETPDRDTQDSEASGSNAKCHTVL